MLAPRREPGGRGRIRTFVARKERQIYSLLVLATHPPVPQNSKPVSSMPSTRPSRENTKRTRVKRHQPVHFLCEDSLRLTPPAKPWWSWRRELNPRPSDYKSDALPAELRQRLKPGKNSRPGTRIARVPRKISSTSIASPVEILSLPPPLVPNPLSPLFS